VSPSALSSFVACPRQFFYKKIVGLRASQQPSLEVDVPANTWGTFVHTALEGDFERLIPLSTEDRKRELCEVMEKQFPGYLPFFTGSEQQLASRIRVQAEAINNTIKWSDLASRSDYESEKYLKADFAGITIAGYADFAWPDHVADAKTGKMKSGAELVKDRVQVQAYSAILAKESDQVVSGELWYLSSKGAAVVSTGVTGETEAQAPVFLTAIDSLKFAVDQGVFPAVGDNSGEMGTTCLYCDFNKICPTDIHDRWEEVKQDEQFSRVHPIKESGGLSSQTEGESA
jgi:CRISPR/Cas system-associated exonuclease Cas4 (RecB family)